jgi:hypothetical protein
MTRTFLDKPPFQNQWLTVLVITGSSHGAISVGNEHRRPLDFHAVKTAIGRDSRSGSRSPSTVTTCARDHLAEEGPRPL